MGTLAWLVGGFGLGWFTWVLAEYLLHRFAMHELKGRGIMSREHLEHHVRASWRWAPIFLASWSGVILVGWAALLPIGLALAGWPLGVGLALGWTVGYFTYEYQHAVAHLRPPTGRYGRWMRRHHFHHHFGHPMANHGVTASVWDRVFGTYERPDKVRVPRRLAMPWLLDEAGAVRPEFADDYELVGRADLDERQAAIDRARAFASVAPPD